MKLSKNFYLSEFKSKDGSVADQNVINNLIILAEQLEVLRAHLGSPITITSGYRSRNHNLRIGGASNSTHVKGMAADIKIPNYTPSQVYSAIEKLIKEGKMIEGGIGLYKTWVHYDIRGTRSRWNK